MSMAMTPDQVRELLRLMREDEALRREMSALVLAESSSAEHARFEREMVQLAAAQRRTDESLAALTARVDAIAVQLTVLTARMDALTERVDAFTERVDALTERVDALTASIESLGKAVRRLTNSDAKVRGILLETKYRQNTGAFFGSILRRARAVDSIAIEDRTEPRLDAREVEDILRLDLVVSGKPRQRPDVDEVWLAVEVSAVLDEGDIARARRRAALLRKAGCVAVPVIAGEILSPEAKPLAESRPLAVLQDGIVTGWDDALADALGSPAS